MVDVCYQPHAEWFVECYADGFGANMKDLPECPFRARVAIGVSRMGRRVPCAKVVTTDELCFRLLTSFGGEWSLTPLACMICTDEANLIAFDVIGCDVEFTVGEQRAASAAVHPSEVPACLCEDPMRAGMASADAPFGDAPCTDFGDEADVLNSLTPADLALIEPFMADEYDEEVQEPGEVSKGDAVAAEDLDALAAVIGVEAEEPLGVVGFVSYE